MREKVMIIGLDGATWTLLSPWISEGKLPTLRKIADLGSTATLESTIPSVTFTALPSLLTGMNPGNHGIFSFIKPDGSPVTSKDVKYPKMWNMLDKNNLRSCIAWVRGTYPPERLHGVMISGSPIPSDKSDYTYPKSLKEDIERLTIFEEEILRLRKKTGDKKYRKKMVDLAIQLFEKKYGIFKKLCQDKDYGLSMFWIEETDFLQHFCWEFKESILRFYIRVDNILSDVLSSFPDRNFFIVSDHGFESTPRKAFSVNTWLHREGYLRKKGGFPIHSFMSLAQLFAYKVFHPKKLERMLAFFQLLRHKSNPQEYVMTRIDFAPGIDRKNSKAYLSTPFGICVNSSSSYIIIREEIMEKLEKLKDPVGENVVRDVWKKEEIFAGRYLKEIPDVIFRTSEKYAPFPALTKNLFYETKRNVLWSGGHRQARDGILMAYGPVIEKENALGNAGIEDICPTILHLIGCAIPKHIDGRTLTEIFKKDSEPARRKPFIKEFTYVPEEDLKLERKEKEKMKDRLRELGYL